MNTIRNVLHVGLQWIHRVLYVVAIISSPPLADINTNMYSLLHISFMDLGRFLSLCATVKIFDYVSMYIFMIWSKKKIRILFCARMYLSCLLIYIFFLLLICLYVPKTRIFCERINYPLYNVRSFTVLSIQSVFLYFKRGKNVIDKCTKDSLFLSRFILFFLLFVRKKI